MAHKLHVVGCEAQEGPELLDVCGRWPVLDGPDFVLVHGNAILADSVAQEVYLWLEEAAFGELAVKLMLAQQG